MKPFISRAVVLLAVLTLMLAVAPVRSQQEPENDRDDAGHTFRKHVSLDKDAVVGTKMLKAGMYLVVIKEDQLRLEKPDGKMLTEVPITWDRRDEKNEHTEFVFNAEGALSEVRLGGSHRIVKVQTQGAATSGQK